MWETGSFMGAEFESQGLKSLWVSEGVQEGE